MSTISATGRDRFLQACQTLLPPPARWPQLNTYPLSLAEAIIDAVWSERVRYSNVIEVVDRYRDFRRAEGGDADTDGARELAATFAMGLDSWIERIGNHQRAFARRDAPYKADVVRQAADAALAAGVESAGDFKQGYAADSEQFRDLRRRWLALPSQRSGLSWARLALALGIETVPQDLWMVEFASHAVGAPVSGPAALSLIDDAAEAMGVAPFRLRNAIWIYQTRLDRSQPGSAQEDGSKVAAA
ncbi:MAG: hypothetical protein LBG60_06465 [Bifidobacteriaceae bacterium]|jgi:hypothetical protein|nr:hypothetical protein [Bifidobacteriaceae bacterium]